MPSGWSAWARLARCTRTRYGGRLRRAWWQEVPVRPDDWAASVRAASVTGYLDAVTAGLEPPVSGSDALETLRLLQQIYDTAQVLGG